jgi:hypothetical protein
MYSKSYYARKKLFSSIGNFLWSVVMFLVVSAVAGVCIYGLVRYFKIVGPTIN